MLSLTECLQIQLNEENEETIKVATSKVVDTLRKNPNYYFFIQGVLTKNNNRSRATIRYNPKEETWDAITGGQGFKYTGGFKLKDDSKIKTVEDLIEALRNCKDRDITVDKESLCFHNYEGRTNSFKLRRTSELFVDEK